MEACHQSIGVRSHSTLDISVRKESISLKRIETSSGNRLINPQIREKRKKSIALLDVIKKPILHSELMMSTNKAERLGWALNYS